MKWESNPGTEYQPDQWDSIFEDYDQEQDEKEKKEKQAIEDEQIRILEGSIHLLEAIEKLLKKGLRHEMPREFKELLGKGPDSYCKGSPDTNRMLIQYSKELYFRERFRELCETHEIDKKTYKIFLKRLYPQANSDALCEMRNWLKEQRDQAPYCPQKECNYLFLGIILLLVFGYLALYGVPPLYAVFPTFLVGVHYALYRILYPKYGGMGSHVRISLGIMLALFFYGERVPLDQGSQGGIFSMTTTYIDMFFIIGTLYLPELIGQSARKKNREMKPVNRHIQEGGV